MREGMLHICDVEGPKKTGSVETRLEAMEQQVFKCQGMVERGLNANHMMITEFPNKHMIDANDIGKHLFRHYDRVDQLQAQIYDLQNQNCDSRMDPHAGASSRDELNENNPDVQMSALDVDMDDDHIEESPTEQGETSHTNGTSSSTAASNKSMHKARKLNKLHEGIIIITTVGPIGEPVTLVDAAKTYSKNARLHPEKKL
ncbi:40S ribosomal protein S5-1 [Hordeum vulgare]|nr:40S ribosomal protein S5-1 [Hordeum vulgare]